VQCMIISLDKHRTVVDLETPIMLHSDAVWPVLSLAAIHWTLPEHLTRAVKSAAGVNYWVQQKPERPAVVITIQVHPEVIRRLRPPPFLGI